MKWEREGGRRKEEGRGEGEKGERASTNRGLLSCVLLRADLGPHPVKLPGGRQGRVRIEDGERDGWAFQKGCALLPALSGLREGRRRGE